MKSGFGCSACNWQSSNLNDFLGDGTGEQPTDHEAPPFVEVLGYELDELNAAKLAPIDVAPTPYPAWNNVCRDEGGGVGVARGWHVLIAGNTGMGKSLLAINVAAHAIRNGEKVGIISLEMSKAQLITRYMSIFSGEKIRRLEWGQAYREDVAANAKAMLEENYERNGGVLLTNKRPISKLSDIISAMRALHETRGCRYFVTDYLQLAWAGSAQNIHDRITEVSHSIRKEAVDLKVVSIGVSQFNRATSGSNERPIVQGMMGGSALENDSNQVLLLDHSTYEDYGDNGALIKLLVAKNRHGSSGEIPLAWDYSTLRAQEVDPREFEEGAKV
jgi:replicative DNA helicase